MLSIGRKCYRTVHVANQNARRASKHRRFVQDGNRVFRFIAADKIKITSIGRKSDSDVASGGGSDDLRFAPGLDVAEVKRLQAAFGENERKKFFLWRNRGEDNVSVVRESFDGEKVGGSAHCFLRERETAKDAARRE